MEAGTERHCLVTVGATAPFRDLLRDVLATDFHAELRAQSFTHLHVQTGADLEWFRAAIGKLSAMPVENTDVFDFDRALVDRMILCREQAGQRRSGVVICHAGTGTILDAWKVGAPVIVVPNVALQDDHQIELAEEIERQAYGIVGRIGYLAQALASADTLLNTNARWRPQDFTKPEVNIWDISAQLLTRCGDVNLEENTKMGFD